MKVMFYLFAAFLIAGYFLYGYRASKDIDIWRYNFESLNHPAWIKAFLNAPMIVIFWLPLLVYGILLSNIGGFKK